MKQLLQSPQSGENVLHDVPTPALLRGGVLVKNCHSLVSAGTEKAMVEFGKQNLLRKARSRPDLVRQVLNKARTDGALTTYRAAMQRLEEGLALGYSCAGVIAGVGEGVEEFQQGDRVACAGAGYASHAEVVFVPKNLVVKLPENLSSQEAAFVTLGTIALQGVRRAELLPGERVAVIGLGLLGLLTVQLLNAYGHPVLGLDVSRRQLEKGNSLGLPAGAVIGEDSVEKAVAGFTDGRGLDAVIITAGTKSSQPVQLAGEICRDRGRVSVVGDVGMDVPRRVFYAKELDLHVSRSYGPGRYDPVYEEKGIDYPIGYVRWTEKRNMEEFLRLVSTGRVDVKSMISHVFKFEEALKAYELIMENPHQEDFTGVLLKYDTSKEHASTVHLAPGKKQAPTDTVTVGLIGGGAFARGTILPALRKLPGVEIKAVATASGKGAGEIARKYGCAYATTDPAEILDDDSVNLVVIATRHNLHAVLAVEALSKGKNVHVEKPLALNIDELREVLQAERASTGRLMVGFNRRFAPMGLKAKSTFAKRSGPLMAHYRINAGFVPRDHWVHDPVEGGGRILGEVCHFVDFLHFLVGEAPVKLYATKVPQKGNVVANDNVTVMIDFADGSRGSILYTAMGDRHLAKEYVEVFCDGKSLTIDNFRTAGPLSLGQDKGFVGEFTALVEAIAQGKPSPIPIDELALSSLATIKILEALNTGEAVVLDLGEVMGGVSSVRVEPQQGTDR